MGDFFDESQSNNEGAVDIDIASQNQNADNSVELPKDNEPLAVLDSDTDTAKETGKDALSMFDDFDSAETPTCDSVMDTDEYDEEYAIDNKFRKLILKGRALPLSNQIPVTIMCGAISLVFVIMSLFVFNFDLALLGSAPHEERDVALIMMMFGGISALELGIIFALLVKDVGTKVYFIISPILRMIILFIMLQPDNAVLASGLRILMYVPDIIFFIVSMFNKRSPCYRRPICLALLVLGVVLLLTDIILSANPNGDAVSKSGVFFATQLIIWGTHMFLAIDCAVMVSKRKKENKGKTSYNSVDNTLSTSGSVDNNVNEVGGSVDTASDEDFWK